MSFVKICESTYALTDCCEGIAVALFEAILSSSVIGTSITIVSAPSLYVAVAPPVALTIPPILSAIASLTAVPTPAATKSPDELITSTPPTDKPFFTLKFFSPAIRLCLRQSQHY